MSVPASCSLSIYGPSSNRAYYGQHKSSSCVLMECCTYAKSEVYPAVIAPRRKCSVWPSAVHSCVARIAHTNWSAPSSKLVGSAFRARWLLARGRILTHQVVTRTV